MKGVRARSRRISMIFGFRSGRLRIKVLWARLKDDAMAIVLMSPTPRSRLRCCLEKVVLIDIRVGLAGYFRLSHDDDDR